MILLEAAHAFPSIFDARADAPTDSATDAAPDQAAAETTVAPVMAGPVAAEPAAAGFAELGVPLELVRALDRAGITRPFPIQAATIPDALAGRDVLGRGQTGSGKTLAFGLPVLARVAASGRAAPHRPKALVLVPTRELAMQVNDALTPLATALRPVHEDRVRRRAVPDPDLRPRARRRRPGRDARPARAT